MTHSMTNYTQHRQSVVLLLDTCPLFIIYVRKHHPIPTYQKGNEQPSYYINRTYKISFVIYT